MCSCYSRLYWPNFADRQSAGLTISTAYAEGSRKNRVEVTVSGFRAAER
jgi:hypothetical protein